MGHLKITNFPFVPNGKFIIFGCPKIWANYSLIIMCSDTGTPNNHHFLYGTNGKVVVLGVPILKHFRVVPGWVTQGSFAGAVIGWVQVYYSHFPFSFFGPSTSHTVLQ